MRTLLQKAFILHHRPYRETSVLLELFTEDHGRIAAIAKGVRQSKSRLKPLLQPFVPLLISCQGKSELMSLSQVEPNGTLLRLKGECLFGGLYLNELLLRLLQKHDPHPELYTIYAQTLLNLQSSNLQQKSLRIFEKNLLTELGYGLPLEEDAHTKEKLHAERYYRFHPEEGFSVCENTQQVNIFPGVSLISLAQDSLTDENSLRDAKRLMRLALAPLMGKYEIQSRKLFGRVSHAKE